MVFTPKGILCYFLLYDCDLVWVSASLVALHGELRYSFVIDVYHDTAIYIHINVLTCTNHIC